MAECTLLGNELLKRRLRAALARGTLSHALLITGPEGAGKKTLTRWLCAALQCTRQDAPCCACAQCRKVLDRAHPDVISVDEPEKATIGVQRVREACADMSIRPNEGNRKIFVFPNAQKLTEQAQNALLKCMEEPPSYGVFLLLAEEPEQLLPTVRSRCAELRMQPLPHEALLAALRARFPEQSEEELSAAARRSEGYLGRAEASLRAGEALCEQSRQFAEAYARGGAGALLRVLVPMEKLKRDALRPILAEWRALVCGALTLRHTGAAPWPQCAEIARNRSDAALLAAADALQKALGQLDANVSPAHLCGALSILLR